MNRQYWPLAMAAATQLTSLAMAADVVYVTDMKLYSSLAPCAASAINNNFYSVSYSTTQCGGGESPLHSCVCSHTADFNSVSSAISSDVSVSCSVSAGATDDFWSASQVLKQYCNPNSIITFSEPKNKVVAYITELSQTSNLAPCAVSAISAVIPSVGYSRCPSDATLFAPCICGKPGVIDDVTQTLSQFARSTCSNAEDATSAQNFFSEYCAMNDGTTSFAGPKNPPGDMTYHITGLPQFKSLRKCAQDALSEVVFAQTYSLCAPGPQALASCICIKSGVFDRVSQTLTSSVKWECDSTAIADVTSAVSVLDHYCKAANDEVVESVGVPASTTEGSPSAPTTPPQTESRTLPASETGGSGSSNSDGGADSDNSNKDKDAASSTSGSGVNRTAIIAAAVLGVLLGLAAIAAIVFFVRRKRQRKAQGEEIVSAAGDTEFQEFNGKPELAAPEPVISRPGTGAVDIETLKPELPTEVSYNEMPTPTTPRQVSNPPAITDRRSMAVSDMSPTETFRPELPTSTPAMPMVQPLAQQQAYQELVSPDTSHPPSSQLQAQRVHEFPGEYPVSPQSLRGSPINGFPMHPPPPAQGWQQQSNHHEMSWQSGPVQAYEMDATDGRQNR